MDFARHMAIQFRRGGEAALYTPPTGPAVPCHVIRAAKPLRIGGVDLPVDGACFDLLRSEVTPVAGGVLNIGGTGYAVDTPPVPFPLDQDPQGLRWRLLCGWGVPVAYRAMGTAAPPRGSDWAVAEDAPAGAASLSIGGTLAAGQIRPGDAFTVAGHPAPYVAAGAVDAVAGTFHAVPVGPTLAAPVTAGTALSPAWGGDVAVRAFPLAASAGFAGSVVDGSGRYLFVAAALPQRPQAGDRLFDGADELEVAHVDAHRVGATAVLWEVQAT